MLLSVKLLSVKQATTAAVTALTIAATAAAPASAGEKEREFLKGALATVAVGTILLGIANQGQARQPAPVYRPAPQPVYRPAPVYDYVPAPAPVYRPAPVPHHHQSIYHSAAARAFNAYSLPERRAIQRRLAAAGYYFGGIDGAFGPGTYNAITAYAADQRNGGTLSTTAGAFAVYDGLILG
ncbi:MAG: hypothetical protein RIR62_939 [Pseudomonadota bacterium]|jgi:hypothetical protein